MQSIPLHTFGQALVQSWMVCGGLWLLYLTCVHLRLFATPKQKHDAAMALLSTGFFYFIYRLGSPAQGALLSKSTWLHRPLDANLYWAWMGWLYLLSLGFALLRLMILSAQNPLKPTMDQNLPVVWRHWIKQTSEQLGLKKIPRVYISEKVHTPRIQGWIRSAIVLPVACLSQLSPQQCEALLLHELEHIRRNDLWWNRWLMLIETCLYLNPFVHILGGIIRKEREQACDDMVLQWKYNPYDYAQSLYLLAAGFSQDASFRLSAGGNSRYQLLERIERMVHPGLARRNLGFHWTWLCLPLAVCLLQVETLPTSQTGIGAYNSRASMPLNKSFFAVAFQHDIDEKKSRVRPKVGSHSVSPLGNSLTASIAVNPRLSLATDSYEEQPLMVQQVRQTAVLPEFTLPLQQLPEVNAFLGESGRPFIQNSTMLYHAVAEGDSTQVWLEKQRWALGLQRMAELEDLMVWMAGRYKPGIDSSGYMAVLQAERYLKEKWQSLQEIDLPIDWYQTKGYETLSARYRSTLLYLSALRLQYFQQESKQ